MINSFEINKHVPGLMDDTDEYRLADCSLLFQAYEKEPVYVIPWHAYLQQKLEGNTVANVTVSQDGAGMPFMVSIRHDYEQLMNAVIPQLYKQHLGDEHGANAAIGVYQQARAELLKAARIKPAESAIAYMYAIVESISCITEMQTLRRAVYTNVFNLYISRISDDDSVTDFIPYIYHTA